MRTSTHIHTGIDGVATADAGRGVLHADPRVEPAREPPAVLEREGKACGGGTQQNGGAGGTTLEKQQLGLRRRQPRAARGAVPDQSRGGSGLKPVACAGLRYDQAAVSCSAGAGYTCMHTYMHVCMHVCMHACMHAYINMNIYKHVYIHSNGS